MVKTSDFQAIKECLESFNVCNRCILRFFGMKEYTSYITKSSIEKAFQQLLDDKACELSAAKHETEDLNASEEEICPPHKKHHFLPCAACLGILQESCDNMVAKVEEATAKSGHEFDDFGFSYPSQLVLDLEMELLRYFIL
ncbi:uncharacterized protein LOC118191175 [Stegodyphus dumicola]|uniref:uncharacterized protein LOC118191175 n=1 Tax=Stegodyphus dumicola TaxID=202533 RepID=UPI0015B15418|nr:uncharacterized protein LOC118191175 [Stegodyphus dumicola]